MTKQFLVKNSGNMVYIADDCKAITDYFDSYDRSDLQKVTDVLNDLNERLIEEKKKNKMLEEEVRSLTLDKKLLLEEMKDIRDRLSIYLELTKGFIDEL